MAGKGEVVMTKSIYMYLTNKPYSFKADNGTTYTGEHHYVAEIFPPDDQGFIEEPRIRKCKTEQGVFKANAGDRVLLDLTTERDRKTGADVPKWINIRLAK